MNKEIIFRGKRKDNGGWVEGKYFVINGRHFIVVNENDNPNYGIRFGSDRMFFAEVIPETVGQYTGLKDKNDKKIYEGDILNQELEKKGEDGWTICGSFGFYPENSKIVEWNRDGWYLGSFRLSGEIKNREVIGNIYENPELLRAEK